MDDFSACSVVISKYIKICLILQLLHALSQLLELGQGTPVFRKGTEYSKCNYRPINILPAFSNIFERIIAHQLNVFFVKIYLNFCPPIASITVARSLYLIYWKNSVMVSIIDLLFPSLESLFPSLESISVRHLTAYLGIYSRLNLLLMMSSKACSLVRDYLTDRF